MAYFNPLNTLFLLLSAFATTSIANAEPPNFYFGHEEQTNFRPWNSIELQRITSLWIGHLSPAQDTTNQYLYNKNAIDLGEQIFFDKRFSANGKVSCSSCHQPSMYFTDGLKTAEGVGKTNRNSPTIVGSSHSPWLFWDGRKDSTWSQALAPMEDKFEHGSNRTNVAYVLFSDKEYRDLYSRAFGKIEGLIDYSLYPINASPNSSDKKLKYAWNQMHSNHKEQVNTIFSNIGKAIAAFENTIQPAPSKLDRYIEAILTNNKPAQQVILNRNELEGLRIFIGRGNCLDCHNGPLLTNHDFQNIGLPNSFGGRLSSIDMVLKDPFNCLGRYSDSQSKACPELKYIKSEGNELIKAFKVPSLRNVSKTSPYMHDGRFASLNEVIAHYNVAPKPSEGNSSLFPLHLTPQQIDQLKAFLKTLDGGFKTVSN